VAARDVDASTNPSTRQPTYVQQKHPGAAEVSELGAHQLRTSLAMRVLAQTEGGDLEVGRVTLRPRPLGTLPSTHVKLVADGSA